MRRRTTMAHSDRHQRTRTPVSVRMSGALLLVQAGGLVLISIVASAAPGGDVLLPPASRIEAAIIGALFVPLAVAAAVAALGMLLSLATSWLLAMSVQALILLATLGLYVLQKPFFVYPLMLSCIIVVLYLNSFDVRVALHVRPTSEQAEVEDGS